MKRHLNTLFVTTQRAYLAAEGETLLVKVEGKIKLRVPLHMLEGVVCFGNVGASPFLMGRCGQRNIAMAFLTERGRFLARVVGPVSGNVLLRRAQYRWADDPQRAALIARTCVAAKIANSRGVLQRGLRDHAERIAAEPVREAVRELERGVRRAVSSDSVDSVRGVEGDAARAYFGVLDHLITCGDDALRFEKRSRRPPTNAVNALLSFVYTLLLHDVVGALSAVGLDAQVGFLHRDRPGRPGLALDLMEELRAFFADRLVLSLLNRRQVRAKGFEVRETGGVYMDDETRKTVLTAYQERKQEELKHPFLDEKTTVGMLPHLQAILLARHIRGDIDAYPAFIAK